MKAELKFKKTNYNQPPEVVTYHTDDIDEKCKELANKIATKELE